ncbi:TPA: alpha/beta hydrolase [Candidatus Woesearchaeota archaeon]|nr:alpha/beta hydrolase [Candidatus Woesearchaeota archaeon]
MPDYKQPVGLENYIRQVRANSHYHVERKDYTTADGMQLYLLRYVPKDKTVKEPVVGLHGIGQKVESLDTIAAELATNGIEFISIEVRGREKSASKKPWGIEDYLTYDLPAGIDEAKKISKSEKIIPFGFSMGSYLWDEYYRRNPDKRDEAKAFVALSFPYDMSQTHHLLTQLYIAYNALHALHAHKFTIPTKRYARLYARLEGIISTADGLLMHMLFRFVNIIYNHENIKNGHLKKELRHNVVDISLQEARDLLSIKVGDLINYIKVPVFFMTGTEDRIAPVASMQEYMGKIKTAEFVSLENAGHLDILYDPRTSSRIIDFIKRLGQKTRCKSSSLPKTSELY